MQIRPLDVEDDAEFARFHEILTAAESFERPWASRVSVQELRVEFRDDDPGERVVGVVAERDGRLVGAGVIYLPISDNLHFAFLVPWVEPELRRQGIGTALVEHLTGIAVDETRSDLMLEAGYPFERREDHPYRRFAERCGYRLANTEVRRVLDLPVDEALLEQMVAEAAPHHDGYRIETFDGPIPDDLLPSLCESKNRLALDAPTGELAFEAEAMDPEMYRHREATFREQGRVMLSTLAISPEGEVVGYNDLVLLPDANPYVSQWGTLVRPEHRGRRLGLAVKAHGLRALQQLAGPERQYVQTCNAEQNRHMVSINERLGFVPVEVAPAFLRQLEL